MLPLLDNFEHPLPGAQGQDEEASVDGASLVGEIIKAAPDAGILVTSRERLNLLPEPSFPIDGLAYPTLENASAESVTDVEKYSAAQLFI